MFDVIIQYTEQVSEDAWSVRYRTLKFDIPGLKEELERHKISSHVVDVQEVETSLKAESADTSDNTPKVSIDKAD